MFKSIDSNVINSQTTTKQYSLFSLSTKSIPPKIGQRLALKMALYCPEGSSTLPQQLLMMHDIALYCIILHYLALSYTTLHYLALSCTILHYLALSCTILHYLALSCTILHYLALSCTILHYLALSCNILHYLAVMSYCTHKVHIKPAYESSDCL